MWILLRVSIFLKKKASDAIFDTIAITETGIYYVTLSIMQIWYIIRIFFKIKHHQNALCLFI